MRLLHPFGFVDGLIDSVVFSAERRIVLRPHAMDNLSGLAEASHPLARVWISIPVGTKLMFVPASTKAEEKAAVTNHINRRPHLGKKSGVPIAVAGGHLTELQVVGIAC